MSSKLYCDPHEAYWYAQRMVTYYTGFLNILKSCLCYILTDVLDFLRICFFDIFAGFLDTLRKYLQKPLHIYFHAVSFIFSRIPSTWLISSQFSFICSEVIHTASLLDLLTSHLFDIFASLLDIFKSRFINRMTTI